MRRGFDQVVRDYRPLPIEAFSAGDPRFRVPMHHLLKNRDRFWLALQAAFRFFPPGRSPSGISACTRERFSGCSDACSRPSAAG